jgi:hypothetical protein
MLPLPASERQTLSDFLYLSYYLRQEPCLSAQFLRCGTYAGMSLTGGIHAASDPDRRSVRTACAAAITRDGQGGIERP